ncbi:MAG: DUF1449 domain-containing protein [Cellvibrionales bacterium]|nr:DUF1449 domain-containing protein [Cellvibrionales bacterium]
MLALLLHESMDPFYQNITSFPTVIYTFVLCIVVLFWLVAILGVVDIDVLDFDVPDADGSLGVNSGHGVETPDVLAGLLLKCKLDGVPTTVSLSILTLFAWLFSYYCVHFFYPFIPDGVIEMLAGIIILFTALYVSVLITAVAIKPLKPLFKKMQQETIKTIVGQTAIVRTPQVTQERGEATLEDGGAGLILKVRSEEGQVFCRGEKVVLLAYDKPSNTYLVVSEGEFKQHA